jgi:hypothetical protein
MKGGKFLKWYGNQDYVINWGDDGAEVRCLLTADGRPASRPQNLEYYFREGLTFSDISGVALAVRYMPPGFVFDHAGNCIFIDGLPEDFLYLLALLNSRLATYLLAINETWHTYLDDLKRVPILRPDRPILSQPVTLSIRIQKLHSVAGETSSDCITPPRWETGLEDIAAAQARLARLETQIDDEVYRLYGIGDENRAAIEAELSGSVQDADSDEEEASDEAEEESEAAAGMTKLELAVRWVSYAVGIVLGRFKPGLAGELGSAVYRREDFAIGPLPMPDEAEFSELVGTPDRFAYIDAEGGRHAFPTEVEQKLRALADTDGIVMLDESHPDDLPARVETALVLMLGERGAAEVIDETGGDLRRFFERDFFTKWHVKWYRKRPVYWLLQSPKKLYGLYLFHERLTKDTLFVVQRKYLDRKIVLTQQLLSEKRAAAGKAASARERRAVNREADEAEKLLADLEEFAKRLKAITDRGYDPHIDDGVILNMAPLWDVIPSWSKEPKKYWDGLEAGDYDWAHIAMNYWPDRVKAKCKTDKSMAIAHGMM